MAPTCMTFPLEHGNQCHVPCITFTMHRYLLSSSWFSLEVEVYHNNFFLANALLLMENFSSFKGKINA